jgi:hypothetical protein
MTCPTKILTEGILYDCLADIMKKGIAESNAVIINWDDIDHAGSTETDSIISDLVLKAGTVGLKLEWAQDLASSGSTFAPNTEDVDGFAATFLSRMATTTADHADRCRELKDGRFVIVYKSKFKGVDDVDQFKVRGWDQGLKLTELAENTNENSGSILFTLANEDGEFERYPYMVFLETDAATSQSTYDTLFAPA